LESLGLLRYEDPDIDIDDGSTSADLNDDCVDLNLDISATYSSSDNFTITVFGNHFIKNCRVE